MRVWRIVGISAETVALSACCWKPSDYVYGGTEVCNNVAHAIRHWMRGMERASMTYGLSVHVLTWENPQERTLVSAALLLEGVIGDEGNL